MFVIGENGSLAVGEHGDLITLALHEAHEALLGQRPVFVLPALETHLRHRKPPSTKFFLFIPSAAEIERRGRSNRPGRRDPRESFSTPYGPEPARKRRSTLGSGFPS